MTVNDVEFALRKQAVMGLTAETHHFEGETHDLR